MSLCLKFRYQRVPVSSLAPSQTLPYHAPAPERVLLGSWLCQRLFGITTHTTHCHVQRRSFQAYCCRRGLQRSRFLQPRPLHFKASKTTKSLTKFNHSISMILPDYPSQVSDVLSAAINSTHSYEDLKLAVSTRLQTSAAITF